MNKIISISGRVNGSPNTAGGGGSRIDKNGYVSSTTARNLKVTIQQTIEDWNKHEAFSNPVVSVRYKRVMPKSLRMSELLKEKGKSVDRTIVGAFFVKGNGYEKHVIVYCVPMEVLESAIKKLDLVIDILNSDFGGIINDEQLTIISNTKKNKTVEDEKYRKNKIARIESHNLPLYKFQALIQDIFFIEEVYINKERIDSNSSMFVSFYDVGLSDSELLDKLHLPKSTCKIGGKGEGIAYYLTPNQIKSVRARFPYLISMEISNNMDIKVQAPTDAIKNSLTIPPPLNEPVIGVIDGSFDNSAYFSEWVDYVDEYCNASDKRHGTAVSSLIVDGPSLNPDLEDGCGRFRVKHYSVMGSSDKISQLELYQKIELVVNENPSIKVWNISLGAIQEIDHNSISPVGALLDRLQNEKDVIFVVCGTNKVNGDLSNRFVGAPADSVNSIIVNAVTKNGQIPDYARKGPVLSFYQCPDFCEIGGASEDMITVCSGQKLGKTYGTSFATCWVTRKVAYLIHYLNCTREEAKAILLDAAYGWNSSEPIDWDVRGCGILPHHIDSIINTPNDEIKIVIKGRCEKYRTYSYEVNLPLDSNGKFPYWAKATLCYFPKTSRKQGVDYTLMEVDLHFGRLSGDESLAPINNNFQGNEGKQNIPESIARSDFRKWDVVKHICEEINPRSKPRIIKFTNRNSKTYAPWGFFLLKKKRTDIVEDNPNFALVLTFKSMDKKNRYNEFVNISRYIGWFVRILDIDVMNTVYNDGQIDLEFDD